MVRKCSIIGCRGNYQKRQDSDDENNVSIFRFPKDKERLQLWLRKIPQDNLTADQITDYMGVCERHFDPRLIIKEYSTTGPDGVKRTWPRDAPVLDPDAVPSIFPNTPSYLSSVPPPKRKAPGERRAEASARDSAVFEQWLDEDSIFSFDVFLCNLSSKTADLPCEWTVLTKSDCIVFVNIDCSSRPIVLASFKVFKDMRVHIFDSIRQRDCSDIIWLLGDECRLSRWSQLPNICSYLQNVCSGHNVVTVTVDERVQSVVNSMKELIHATEKDENDKVEFGLKFLLEQLQLLFAAQKRYSPDCLLLAFSIFCSSRSAYIYLRDRCLTLPHTSYLRQLSSCFSHCSKTLTDDDSHFVYLKQKCSLLNENERHCVMMLDEIYVSPKVAYKGGRLEGFAENSGSDVVQATTVQAFMISSVFSKHKDVAALQPVKNMDAAFLEESTRKVVALVEKAGYKVVALISDNNRINRNMFEKLCGGNLQPSIPHPCDPESGRKLFFLFDSVHLLKCVRNNWINQIDQTFRYPDHATATTGVLCKASFAHLKQLYDSEQSAVIKMAPSLTYTSLHPNNLQRQSVNLALKVFNEKNIAALEQFGKSINCDLSGTQNFISTIVQLWKILNVKHHFQGQRLNDPFCEPINCVTDWKLQWLQSFSLWLCSWESSSVPQKQGVLTRETMFALKHTTSTMCCLVEYLLSKLQFRYVLLGKFQTDYLEFRFSQYRQLSGANYNVSVCQIMESEKKLKLFSVMKIVKCGNGALTLKDFITSCQKEMNSFEQDESEIDICLQPFMSIFTECDSLIIAENEMSAIIFVSGYIGFKLKGKLACIDCRIEILTERALDCDYPCDDSFEYLSKVDRGRLTWPTDLLVDIVVQAITVFKCLVAEPYYKLFSSVPNQRAVIAQLALERCKQVTDLTGKCSNCDKDLIELARMSIKIVCNIMLNNHTKRLADCQTKSKTLRKLSTLVN